jgi:CheY-like chemotaxis protein
MNEQLRDVKTILDQTLPETIEIQLSLADDIVSVRADRAEIENVLMNLALNARDSMVEGGLLRMETSLVDARNLPTPGDGAAEDGIWVLLRVSDTGHGMDEATLGRIFDPFFTTKGVGAGTGLGLSTVYGIVKGYGGRVDCTSEVGRGTVFEIHLPGMSKGSLPVEAETASTRAHRQGVETILLVDDEALIVKVMRSNLEEHGYAVHSADSGERAIEVFEECGDEIDVVVLDLGMPGMGGRACLQRLLEIDPDVKVIISSGYGARDDHEEMLNFGARGFLGKPHQLADLLSEIDALLST